MDDSPPQPQTFTTMDLSQEDDPTPSPLWDFSPLCDFTIHDVIHTPLSDHPQIPLPDSQPPGLGTQIDDSIENEKLPVKKRVRTAGVGSSSEAHCQVPGCHADISDLKGYHKRHRVCLGCANASYVLIDGQNRRYCQQCGKFHFLSDFDEGKRSCRRKLERHNNRRRRKPADTDVERQGIVQNKDSGTNADDGKDTMCLIDQRPDQRESTDFEDQCVSIPGSAPGTQNTNTDTALPLVASFKTQTNKGKELSSTSHDNKSDYSTECPTGRISFKLYDWNPAEFPRRLRLQIFQWLASMPVELEGYIRPGCTILTAFIAMPEKMWAKLSKDPETYLDELIFKPGKILSGRGSITVYLNNMIFRVIKGGISVRKVDVELQAPKLHFVYPTCFEAGKSIEFFVSGSNLLQPKSRFLVSFGGMYLPYEYSVASPNDQDRKKSPSCNHQLCKIHIRHSDPNLFGPAFVEVENVSGLSNFIPLIIGDEAICSEMRLIEQQFDASFFPEGQQTVACDSLTCSCKDFEVRQSGFSGLLLDIAWSVKVPSSECTEQPLNCCQIRRYIRVLSFLLQRESTAILENVLRNLETLMKKMGSDGFSDGTCDSDLRVLQESLNLGRDLCRKRRTLIQSESAPICINRDSQGSSQNDMTERVNTVNQDPETRVNYGIGVQAASFTTGGGETDPLLEEEEEVIVNINHAKERLRMRCSAILAFPALLIVTTVFCFVVFAVLYHPDKVTNVAVSIRSQLMH